MSIVEGVVRRRARDRALVVLDAYGMRGRGERDEMADAIVDAVFADGPVRKMAMLDREDAALVLYAIRKCVKRFEGEVRRTMRLGRLDFAERNRAAIARLRQVELIMRTEVSDGVGAVSVAGTVAGRAGAGGVLSEQGGVPDASA